LLCLPKDDTQWLSVSSEKLILQRCAYWLQLDGALTANTATRRVRIPTANVFNPDGVTGILEEIRIGRMLP
jgi:hypothetical protein